MSSDKQVVPVTRLDAPPIERPKVGAQLRALAIAKKRKRSPELSPEKATSSKSRPPHETSKKSKSSKHTPPSPRRQPEPEQKLLTYPPEQGTSSGFDQNKQLSGRITCEFTPEKKFLRALLPGYSKLLEQAIEGAPRPAPGIDSYFSDIVQDFQLKTAMVGLDAYMQTVEFLQGLEKNNPVDSLQREIKSLKAQVEELTEKNHSKSAAIKKTKSKLVHAQAKRAEAEKVLAEEMQRSKESHGALKSRVSELEEEIVRLKNGEGLDPFSLIDTPPFAEVQDAWNSLNLIKFQRALSKFHPSVDQSFLDDGIPDVEEEEAEEKKEVEGSDAGGDTEVEEEAEKEESERADDGDVEKEIDRAESDHERERRTKQVDDSTRNHA